MSNVSCGGKLIFKTLSLGGGGGDDGDSIIVQNVFVTSNQNIFIKKGFRSRLGGKTEKKIREILNAPDFVHLSQVQLHCTMFSCTECNAPCKH